MTAEFWAVLMAVKRAQVQVPLTVCTDVQTLPGMVEGRDATRKDLRGLITKIHLVAQKREIDLNLRWNPRNTGRQVQAHELAFSGRTRAQNLNKRAAITVHVDPSGELLVEVLRVTARATRICTATWQPGSSAEHLTVALGLLDRLDTVELKVENAGEHEPLVLEALRTHAPHLKFSR